MKKQHVIDYYGSTTKVAQALGVERSTVHRWKELVPIKTALEIQKLTDGRLMVNTQDYIGRNK